MATATGVPPGSTEPVTSGPSKVVIPAPQAVQQPHHTPSMTGIAINSLLGLALALLVLGAVMIVAAVKRRRE